MIDRTFWENLENTLDEIIAGELDSDPDQLASCLAQDAAARCLPVDTFDVLRAAGDRPGTFARPHPGLKSHDPIEHMRANILQALAERAVQVIDEWEEEQEEPEP